MTGPGDERAGGTRPLAAHLAFGALYTALATVSFLAVASALSPLVPVPESEGMRMKMEFFERHKDEYDTVFIGSSRVNRGVDNAWIDAELGRRGIEMHSFNLAIGGLGPYAQDYVLEQILDLEPARLRRVFLEGGPTGLGLREKDLFQKPANLWTTRFVYWHSPRVTANVLRSIFTLPVSPWRKLQLTARHLGHAGCKLGNYGMGEGFLSSLKRDEAARTQEEERWGLPASGGHIGYRKQPLKTGEAILVTPEEFEQRILAIPEESAREMSLEEINVAMVEAQFQRTAEHDVDLIYFVMPGYEGDPERRRLNEAGVIPVLLDFNEPARYPELFLQENRWDRAHLNAAGVRLFAEHFADALVELLEH